MLRHTFVTTMLDAGAGLRDVQMAARPAGPRTTMRYDRAGQNLDRHPNHILAACLSVSGWRTCGLGCLMRSRDVRFASLGAEPQGAAAALTVLDAGCRRRPFRA
jgi:hypothetical protein